MRNSIRRSVADTNRLARRREQTTDRHARLVRGSDSPGWLATLREIRVYLLAIALAAFLLVLGVGEVFAAAERRLSETVSGEFGECSADGPELCVVDGDTFRIGERRVRVVGIDTAERRARCDAERAAAQASTQALRSWLNRGPFQMTANGPRAIDRYGRELQVVARVLPGGDVEELAAWMQAEGGARVYGGGARAGWC